MIETARLAAFVDGVSLNNVLQSVSLVKESGRQPVETLDGLLGLSEGSKTATVELQLAVPIGGETYAFDERHDDGALVALQLFVGDKSFTANGKVMDWRVEQSVGEATKQTVTIRCEPKKNQ